MNEHIVNLMAAWAEQDYQLSHDDLVDMECPVDGSYIPVKEKINATKAWEAFNQQCGNRPDPTVVSKVWREGDHKFTGGMILAGQAIREERLGIPLERFESFFEPESEDHLDPVIEALDLGWHMTYHDAVNAANVY